MFRRRLVCVFAGAVLLAGCGEDAGGDAPVTPTPSPVATPTPTPLPTPRVTLPRHGLRPTELGIVYNTADPDSMALARYYAERRGVPEANLVAVELPLEAVASVGEFEVAKAAVDAALGAEVQALALAWTWPYRVDCMSVTSAFTLGFDRAYCGRGADCTRTQASPLFASQTAAPFTDFGVRPAMALAGASLEHARALVDRGLAADDTFPGGVGYLIRTSDEARSSRWASFPLTVSDWVHEGGLELHFVDNADGSGRDHIEGVDELLFYFTGLTEVPAIDTHRWRPGAVADHLTSFGGEVPESSQMSILRWLEAGATASYGTVVEPCSFPEKFPEPRLLLPAYFRGDSVLEAYWKSVATPGEGLFIGEPLARPWGADEIRFEDRRLEIRTTLLVPGLRYALRGRNSEAEPWQIVVDDIRIATHARTTLVVENATLAEYALRRVSPEGP